MASTCPSDFSSHIVSLDKPALTPAPTSHTFSHYLLPQDKIPFLHVIISVYTFSFIRMIICLISVSPPLHGPKEEGLSLFYAPDPPSSWPGLGRPTAVKDHVEEVETRCPRCPCCVSALLGLQTVRFLQLAATTLFAKVSLLQTSPFGSSSLFGTPCSAPPSARTLAGPPPCPPVITHACCHLYSVSVL